jgi:hypothetical protein
VDDFLYDLDMCVVVAPITTDFFKVQMPQCQYTTVFSLRLTVRGLFVFPCIKFLCICGHLHFGYLEVVGFLIVGVCAQNEALDLIILVCSSNGNVYEMGGQWTTSG